MTAYRGTRDDLAWCFGEDFVTELDWIEKEVSRPPSVSFTESHVAAILSLPQPLEPSGGDARVAHGVARVAMPEIILHRSEIGTLVGEIVAA
jgi:hypothetical protein